MMIEKSEIKGGQKLERSDLYADKAGYDTRCKMDTSEYKS